MLCHDDINLYVPVTIPPGVVNETVRNPQNIAPLDLRSKQYRFGIVRKGSDGTSVSQHPLAAAHRPTNSRSSFTLRESSKLVDLGSSTTTR